MKKFEINSFGMQEMTVQETRNTDGGSLTVLLVCAAAALLFASCDGVTVNIFSNNTTSVSAGDVTVGNKTSN